jgi:CheY-like chemotaxis protein
MSSYQPPDAKPTGPTRTALLVEDEHSTLRFYMAGLKGLQEFRLLSAENGREALEQIKKQPVDVVVTDLNMPVLDGYGLIAILSEKYPSLPVIVITSVNEPTLLNRALDLGALRVMAKPPKLSALMEEIRAAVARAPQGVVQGLGIPSLLQLLHWEKKTATLTVQLNGVVGFLYVKDGELIHAALNREEGVVAAYTILAWEGAHIEFVSTCRVPASIDLPMTEILLNSALFKDIKQLPPVPRAEPEGPPVPPSPWFG